VKVTLTIPNSPSSIVKTTKIAVIDPGEIETVSFKNFPDIPYNETVSLKVDVTPVPSESNKGNNSYEYPVIFSLVT
jgi:hypothetical protein